MSDEREKIEKENADLTKIEKKSEMEVESIRLRLSELKTQLELKRSLIPQLQRELEEYTQKKVEIEREAESEMQRLFRSKSVLVPSETPQQVTESFAETFLRSSKKSDRSFQFLSFPQCLLDKIQEEEKRVQAVSGRRGYDRAAVERMMQNIRSLFVKATLQKPAASVNIRAPFQRGVLTPYSYGLCCYYSLEIEKATIGSVREEEENEEVIEAPDSDDCNIPLDMSMPVFSDLSPRSLLQSVYSILTKDANDIPQIRRELSVAALYPDHA